MLLRNLLIFGAILLLSCNSQESPHSAAGTNGEHQKAISLHNGMKWKSDLSTRKHVENLIIEIAAFQKQQIPGKDDYQALGSTLQTELNSLLKDCRMKGAEHEALHSWLEPVLEKVKELENPGSPSQKAETVKQLEMQVNKFNQYFN